MKNRIFSVYRISMIPLRQKVYDLLDNPLRKSLLSRFIDGFLIVIIVLSALETFFIASRTYIP